MSQPYYGSGEPWQGYGSSYPYPNFQGPSTSEPPKFYAPGRGMYPYNTPAGRGRSQEETWRAPDAGPRGSWRGKRRANRGRRSSNFERRKPYSERQGSGSDKRKPDLDKREPNLIKLEGTSDKQGSDVDEHESDLDGREPRLKRKRLDDESNCEDTSRGSSPTGESPSGRTAGGSGGARLPCTFCRDNTFASGGELGLHMWKKHLYCTVCCLQSDLSDMGRHEPCWTSSLMLQYTCKFCSKDCYNMIQLFRHIVFKHQYCNICLTQSTEPDFDIHRRCWLKLHPRKRFFCQFCSAQFEQKKKRNQHLRTAHHTCHMCLAKYITDMRDHKCGTGKKKKIKIKFIQER